MHVLIVLAAFLFAAATPYLSVFERPDVEWSDDDEFGETSALDVADVDQRDA